MVDTVHKMTMFNQRHRDVMIKLHHYTTAEWIARDHGLEVIQACPVSIPDGVPNRRLTWQQNRDHYGNYLTALSVYIGTAEQRDQLPKNHAYGLLVQSIHDNSCSIAGVLIDIAEKLQLDAEFSDRQAFEDYMLRGDMNRAPIGYRDQLRCEYRDFKNTAARAKKCLTPEVITKLEKLLSDA